MSRTLKADCYIYIYQLDRYLILPSYPETLSDSLGSTFATTNILARTAPIYSYSNSGPRTLQVTLDLHRDMLNEVNYDNTKFLQDERFVGYSGRTNPDGTLNTAIKSPDYVDALIRYLQAMALPAYKSMPNAGIAINPPLVSVQFGTTAFIKGIVSGNVGVTYSGPLTRDGKYQMAQISFTILEVKPTHAEEVAQTGSWRGLAGTISRGLSLT